MKNVNLNETIKMTGQLRMILRDAKTGQIKSEDVYKNMVVTLAKNSIADHMRGTTANNKGIVTYIAVGVGGVAPTLTDTKLQSELFRKLLSVREISASADNIAEFTVFFTTSEANGSLTEAGLFGDAASATTDSGTLYCRTLINRVKTVSDTLTMVWSVTIG